MKPCSQSFPAIGSELERVALLNQQTCHRGLKMEDMISEVMRSADMYVIVCRQGPDLKDDCVSLHFYSGLCCSSNLMFVEYTGGGD